MNLQLLVETLAVIRWSPYFEVPQWAYQNKSFLSITYTDEELSIVCDQANVPVNLDDAHIEGDWRAIKVVGPLDFSLTGILASLAATLAKVEVSIFALSTYNTDYLLVKSNSLNKAIDALQNDGHTFVSV